MSKQITKIELIGRNVVTDRGLMAFNSGSAIEIMQDLDLDH